MSFLKFKSLVLFIKAVKLRIIFNLRYQIRLCMYVCYHVNCMHVQYVVLGPREKVIISL